MAKFAGNGTLIEEYVYDPKGDQASAHNSSGILRNELYDPNGRHEATYSGGLLTYNFADWLGTERVQTNSTCTAAFTDMPYGMNLAGIPCDNSPMHFTGKQKDTETGLDYFGARFSSSNLGRFMTADPSGIDAVNLADPQTWNMYAYVRNNPITLIDPTGLDLHFANDNLEKDFLAIGIESPTFLDEMVADWLDHNIYVDIVPKGLKTMANNAPSETVGFRDADGKWHLTVYAVDDQSINEHEMGHVNDARVDPTGFATRAKEETDAIQNPNNTKAHDDFLVEKKANAFRKLIEDERKKYRQRMNALKKARKQAHKKAKSGKVQSPAAGGCAAEFSGPQCMGAQ